MKVMASVFTTPYTSHTTSQAQWRFQRFVWRSTNAHPRLTWRRIGKRRAGACSSSSLTDHHLLFVVLDRATGQDHEHVLEVDVLERLAVGDRLPQLGRRALSDEASSHDEGDAIAQRLGLSHVMRREEDRGVVIALHLADEGLNVALATRVEPRCGLVEQHQHRQRQEGAGYRDLLLLSA